MVSTHATILAADTFTDWPASCRLWFYNADRDLTPDEIALARRQLSAFAKTWSAHGAPLAAYADVVFGRVLVLGVDQAQAGASGCSIDSSVRAVTALGEELGVDFFNRMIFLALTDPTSVRAYDRASFGKAYASGVVDDDTLVVDLLVKSMAEADQNLVRPLGTSWHARMV